jgi:8-hydroxy-5-deazaflavin:NADPH oxidoreductase
MRIGVLGTGIVGRTLGTRLAALGNEVMMGSRTAGNETAAEWAKSTGGAARHGTFADASAFGELVVNCTPGTVSLAALQAAGAENLRGKLLIDVSNPLDFSGGMPPTLGVSNTDSVGEQIQRAFPEARVVKTLNTINCEVMIAPGRVPGLHNLFLSGDDAGAKDETRRLLQSLGWPPASIIDLGGIATARGPEMYLALWVRLRMALGTSHFNVAVMVGE